MSFGFSVGDFLADANLAHSLVCVLSDSRGSSKEYQLLMQELDGIYRICIRLENITAADQMHASTLNAVVVHVKICKKVMKDFLTKIEKYQKSLSVDGSGSKVVDACRKVQWGFSKSSELVSLRYTLRQQLLSISVYLGLAGLYVS